MSKAFRHLEYRAFAQIFLGTPVAAARRFRLSHPGVYPR